MTATELRSHPTIVRLAQIQESLQLNDNDLANQLRFKLHGANWGKILAGTYTGRFDRAVVNLGVALDDYEHGASGETEDGIVVLDHVRQALDAVDIARSTEDEHRLIVISGVRGSGKSRTLHLIHSKHTGHLTSARPSWSGAYLNFLNKLAAGMGLPESRSAGSAESLIIDHMQACPAGVLCLDEFNYFSSNAVGFIKTIINETTWTVVVTTVPHHLNRMAADRSTAQESAQLLRRAVAIIHIPAVSTRVVDLIRRALFPGLDITGHTQSIATTANRLDRIDSIVQILTDIDPDAPSDVPKAIARHERFHRTSLKPSEE